MPRTRPLPRLRLRRVAAVAALVAQLFVAAGAPLPAFASPRTHKKSGAPFPCQNHPCGCQTSEQGWAGDCCCFSLEEKLAWADAHGVTPPAHVRPLVEARQAARKPKESCCAKKSALSCCDKGHAPEEPEPAPPKLAVRWVAGMFAQKCKGDDPAAALKLELGAGPTSPEALPDAPPAGENPPDLAPRQPGVSATPPTPPPKVSPPRT
ncbi:MAG: hypothetical protein K2V38_15015 [Gemmataceae bacterium]|nr:hypothetical protein [Gemmataceae bacterium]